MWSSQLSVSKLGIVKFGAACVNPLDLDPFLAIRVDAVTNMQARFPDHTIWLVREQIHIIRADGLQTAALWAKSALLEGYCSMNVQNLSILADYLDTIEADGFDMGRFCTDEHDEALDPKLHECGTVACAAGHGPKAGFPVTPDDYSWGQYVERVFGIDTLNDAGMWCFGGYWEKTDNTAAGAAKRIRHLITNGIPTDADEQRMGIVPYIFA